MSSMLTPYNGPDCEAGRISESAYNGGLYMCDACISAMHAEVKRMNVEYWAKVERVSLLQKAAG